MFLISDFLGDWEGTWGGGVLRYQVLVRQAEHYHLLGAERTCAVISLSAEQEDEEQCQTHFQPH